MVAGYGRDTTGAAGGAAGRP